MDIYTWEIEQREPMEYIHPDECFTTPGECIASLIRALKDTRDVIPLTQACDYYLACLNNGVRGMILDGLDQDRLFSWRNHAMPIWLHMRRYTVKGEA